MKIITLTSHYLGMKVNLRLNEANLNKVMNAEYPHLALRNTLSKSQRQRIGYYERHFNDYFDHIDIEN